MICRDTGVQRPPERPHVAGVSFIESREQQVLLMDFIELRDATQLARLTDEAIAAVRSIETPHSLLALLDLTGTPINRAALAALRKLSENNGPFIRSMAFVGLGAMAGSALEALLRATGRSNHRVFREKAKALEWLTRQ
jgi:hypothetical protein